MGRIFFSVALGSLSLSVSFRGSFLPYLEWIALLIGFLAYNIFLSKVFADAGKSANEIPPTTNT